MVVKTILHTLLHFAIYITSDVNAITPFVSKTDLESEVNLYCDDPFNVDTFKYGTIDEWDVSKITDMAELFLEQEDCDPDIESWDVSSVTNFDGMFEEASSFDHDIGGWDVSKGESFESMFKSASDFDQDIGEWDVSNGLKFDEMFEESSNFDQDIGGWDVSKGETFNNMFSEAEEFNQSIGDWDVSKGESFESMFYKADNFDQFIGEWDVSKGLSFNSMFRRSGSFNQNITGWDVSKSTDCTSMFERAESFQQDLTPWVYEAMACLTSNKFCYHSICNSAPPTPTVAPIPTPPTPPTTSAPTTTPASFLSKEQLQYWLNIYCYEESAIDISTYGTIDRWDVSKITDMESLFYLKRECNPNIGAWDVSSVTNFGYMFDNSIFNQDIGGWDVSSGDSFTNMFHSATSFNQEIGGWDVSNGLKFNNMFRRASNFDKNIGEWDVSLGENFDNMFHRAYAFDQNIGEWNVSNGSNFSYMFNEAIAFNQYIGGWDVSKGENFAFMFNKASTFDQDIGGWDVSKSTDCTSMFNEATAFYQGVAKSWNSAVCVSSDDFCSGGAFCDVTAAPVTLAPTLPPTTMTPTSLPSVTPSLSQAPTMVKSLEPSVEVADKYEWDISNFGNSTISGEIPYFVFTFAFNISNRLYDLSILQEDCETPVGDGALPKSENVYGIGDGYLAVNASLTLDTSTIMNTNVWTSNGAGGSIDFCTKMAIYHTDLNSEVVMMHFMEDKYKIDVDMAAGFSITNIDTIPYIYGSKNYDLDYEARTDTFQCDDSFNEIVSPSPLLPGSNLTVCVTLNETANVWNWMSVVEYNITQSGNDNSPVNVIVDGDIPFAYDYLTGYTCLTGLKPICKMSFTLLYSFWAQLSMPDITATGIVKLGVQSNSNSRHLESSIDIPYSLTTSDEASGSRNLDEVSEKSFELIVSVDSESSFGDRRGKNSGFLSYVLLLFPILYMIW